MPSCVAFGCTNTSLKGYSMIPFPQDKRRRKLWERGINRDNWLATNDSFLCEEHFDGDQWRNGIDGTRALKCSAVPNLFLSRQLKEGSEKKYSDNNDKEIIIQIKSDCNKHTKNLVDSPLHINDLEKCRICLVDGDDSMVPLDSEISSLNAKLIEIINSFTKINMTIRNEQSNQVCLFCFQRILNAYLLIEQCEENEREFQQQNIINVDDEGEGESKCEKEDIISDIQVLQEENNKRHFVHCKECEVSFNKADVSLHISDCKMRKNISKFQQKQQLLICKFCHTLVYLHDKDAHDNICVKLRTNLNYKNYVKEDNSLKEMKVSKTESNDEIIKEKIVHKDMDTSITNNNDKELSMNTSATLHPTEPLYNYEKYKHESSCKILGPVFNNDDRILNNCNTVKDYCMDVILTDEPHDILQCNECHKNYTSLVALNQHKLSTHQSMMSCDHCKLNIPRNKWKLHNQKQCKLKKIQCTLCDRNFSTITDLQMHIQMHTANHIYKCSICRKQFQKLKSLKEHYLTHKTPYTCHICNEVFVSYFDLNTHQKIHNFTRSKEKCDEYLGSNIESEFQDVEYLIINEN